MHSRAGAELPISINPLNAQLNPVCHLLALLGAHHIFHVSRIRVKDLSFNSNLIVILTA
jgi:hypothetical protein